MPASNRRPLWDGEDVQCSIDNSKLGDAHEVEASSMITPPPAPATVSAVETPHSSFKQPCTFKGAASAFYAGALGYFLGGVPATIKFKARQWGMIHNQGLASAQQLALMSGMYTAVHCICQRIRMVEDGWNRGIAGCSTGLVLGWSNGPWSALQSCAGLGLISALIDLGGGLEAAEACSLPPLQQRTRTSTHSHSTDATTRHPQDWFGDVGRALSSSSPAIQLLALSLGASPCHLSQEAGGPQQQQQQQQPWHLNTAAAQCQPQEEQQQQHRHKLKAGRGGKHKVQVVGESGCLGGAQGQQQKDVYQTHSLMQAQQQQLWSAERAWLQQAASTVQHVLAAPPLMYLGACCSSSSLTGKGPRALQQGGQAAAEAPDGCPVRPVPPI